MAKAVRSLRQLRGDGGDNAMFTFAYVGDFLPPTKPHEAVWQVSENHWLDTNKKFSECGDELPDGVVDDEARRKVEQLSMAFLFPLALDNWCWRCP